MENNNVRSADEQSAYGKREYAALTVAVLLWLIRYLPFLFPDARLWGINHLLFLPPVFTYMYLAAGCVIFLMSLSPARGVVSKIYESFAESLFGSHRRIKLLLFMSAAIIVFWIFRLPVKLLGDSQTVIANVSGSAPVILKWSEIVSIYTVYAVSKFLPFTGVVLGRYAYEIVSVLSGAFTILFAGGIAYELAETGVRRLFVLLLTVFAGWIVLFFGYTENYPILWIFMVGYIYYGIRYTMGRSRLLWPTVFLLAAIAIHLQALFFAISYPILFFSRGWAAQFYARRKKIVWAAAAVLAAAGAANFALTYRNSLELSLMIIPLLTGRPMTPGYWLFSPAHLLDIVNEYLLLAPLLPALIILGWKSPRRIAANMTDLFLSAFSLGGLFFIFIIDPKLGMARDWDLFALVGLPWLLLFASNVGGKQKISTSLYWAVILASGLMVSPWGATNLRYQPAVDYFKFALNLDLPRSRSALIVLRQMYLNAGDSTTADSLDQVVNQKFPSMHLYPEAKKLVQQGRFDKAKILIDSLETLDPTMVEFLTIRGYWNLERRKYYAALEDLKQAAILGKYDPQILANLAGVYFALHRYEAMMKVLRRGQRRNPNSKDVLLGFAVGFYTMNNYDSAALYANRLMEEHPDESDAYFILGMTASKMGQTDRARAILRRYLEMAPHGTYAKLVENALQELK